LQGHHGCRRLRDRARHRRSKSSGRHGRILWRIHDRLDRHPDRISDLAQQYYLSDAGEVMAEYFGGPWESAASLAAHSAIPHVKSVNVPFLTHHGKNDRRVPIGQAWEFYRALKALNKTVEFDIYPRGGHVNYEPPLEREYMRRNLEW